MIKMLNNTTTFIVLWFFLNFLTQGCVDKRITSVENTTRDFFEALNTNNSERVYMYYPEFKNLNLSFIPRTIENIETHILNKNNIHVKVFLKSQLFVMSDNNIVELYYKPVDSTFESYRIYDSKGFDIQSKDKILELDYFGYEKGCFPTSYWEGLDQETFLRHKATNLLLYDMVEEYRSDIINGLEIIDNNWDGNIAPIRLSGTIQNSSKHHINGLSFYISFFDRHGNYLASKEQRDNRYFESGKKRDFNFTFIIPFLKSDAASFEVSLFDEGIPVYYSVAKIITSIESFDFKRNKCKKYLEDVGLPITDTDSGI